MYRRHPYGYSPYGMQSQGDQLAYQSAVDPNVMQTYMQIMQQKDTHAREAFGAYTEAEGIFGQIPTVPGDRDMYGQRLTNLRERMEDIVQNKYHGDISLAAPEISRLISSEQGTFAQAARDYEEWSKIVEMGRTLYSQGQLGRYIDPETRQLTQLNLNDIMNVSTFDEAGNYIGLGDVAERVYARGDHVGYIRDNIARALNDTRNDLFLKANDALERKGIIVTSQQQGLTSEQIDALFTDEEFVNTTVRSFLQNSPQAMKEFEGAATDEVAGFIRDVLQGQIHNIPLDSPMQDPTLRGTDGRGGSDEDRFRTVSDMFTQTKSGFNRRQTRNIATLRNSLDVEGRMQLDELIATSLDALAETDQAGLLQMWYNVPNDINPLIDYIQQDIGIELSPADINILESYIPDSLIGMGSKVGGKMSPKDLANAHVDFATDVFSIMGSQLQTRSIYDLSNILKHMSRSLESYHIYDLHTDELIPHVQKDVTLRSTRPSSGIFDVRLKGDSEEWGDRYVLVSHEPTTQEAEVLRRTQALSTEANLYAQNEGFKAINEYIVNDLKNERHVQRDIIRPHPEISQKASTAIENFWQRGDASNMQIKVTNYGTGSKGQLDTIAENLAEGKTAWSKDLVFAGIIPATLTTPTQLAFRLAGAAGDEQTVDLMLVSEPFRADERYLDPYTSSFYNILNMFDVSGQLMSRDLIHRFNAVNYNEHGQFMSPEELREMSDYFAQVNQAISQ